MPTPSERSRGNSHQPRTGLRNSPTRFLIFYTMRENFAPPTLSLEDRRRSPFSFKTCAPWEEYSLSPPNWHPRVFQFLKCPKSLSLPKFSCFFFVKFPAIRRAGGNGFRKPRRHKNTKVQFAWCVCIKMGSPVRDYEIQYPVQIPVCRFMSQILVCVCLLVFQYIRCQKYFTNKPDAATSSPWWI